MGIDLNQQVNVFTLRNSYFCNSREHAVAIKEANAAAQRYCITVDCRRSPILKYFGETELSYNCCKCTSSHTITLPFHYPRVFYMISRLDQLQHFCAANCDNCKRPGGTKCLDFSKEARILLGTVRTCGGGFGIGLPIDVLRGSQV